MQKPGSVWLTLHSLCGQPCMEFTSYFYTLSNTTFCIQSNNSLNHHTPTVKPLTVWQCLKTTYATWSCSLNLDFALLHIWHKINNNILFATFLMPSYKPEDLCKLSEAFLRRFPLQVSNYITKVLLNMLPYITGSSTCFKPLKTLRLNVGIIASPSNTFSIVFTFSVFLSWKCCKLFKIYTLTLLQSKWWLSHSYKQQKCLPGNIKKNHVWLIRKLPDTFELHRYNYLCLENCKWVQSGLSVTFHFCKHTFSKKKHIILLYCLNLIQCTTILD